MRPRADSADDAIYAHTPNPNGTAFPHDFAKFTFGVRPPALLRSLLEGTGYQLGVTVFEQTPWFAVVPPESMPDRWRNKGDQTPNPSLQRTNPG